MKPYNDPETGLRIWIPRPQEHGLIQRVIAWLIDHVHEAKEAINGWRGEPMR